MNTDALKGLLPRPRLLLRGESAVASVGIAVVVILLAAVAAAGWWMLRTQREALELARREQVQAVGAMLSQAAEPLLATGEVSAVRRMVLNARRSYQLTECRVLLADGRVIADAQPSHINCPVLPETWPVGVLDPPAANGPDAPGGDVIALTFPVRVPGKGQARVELSAVARISPAAFWESEAVAGAIGTASLAALLLTYRRARARMRTLGVIREALLCIQAGEKSGAALTLGADMGPEASAWNELIGRAEKLTNQSAIEAALGSVGSWKQSRGELDVAFDALPHGLLVLDDKLRVQYANGAAAVLLGCKRDKAVGAEAATILTNPRALELLTRTTKPGGPRRGSIEIKGQDGSAKGVLRVTVRALSGDAGGSLVLIEDVTQQRVADAARNAFVAQATHELRTPLTNIRLCLEAAMENGDKDPAARANSLNVMSQESRRLEQLVGELLSVAEIEAGSLKLHRDDVKLDEMLRELDADYQAQARAKHVALSFQLPPKVPTLHADREKVALALQNLLGNALKYTPTGGKVVVGLKVLDGRITVDVADTGIGIRQEEADLIFDKFYRAKDPRIAKIPGSGLGLTLAREVVRLHGGDITVQSDIDRGSTFTMTLPIQATAA